VWITGTLLLNPSRVSFPSRVSIIVPVVPESTASNGVDDDEENEEDDVDYCHLLPVILDVGEDSSLAGLTVIAEDRWIVLPCIAVGDVGDQTRWFRPDGCILEGEVTFTGRVAASSLNG